MQTTAMAIPGIVVAGAAGVEPRRRTLRIAHLTDIHLQPERDAPRWVEAVLRELTSLDDPPDLVLNGGDVIMDALAANEERTRVQWELVQRAFAGFPLPLRHCIGNHDIWGWNQAKSGATGSERLYGKAWALEALGLAACYYTFDMAGWHFVVLDSSLRTGDGYTARLDEAQFDWLEADLAATPATTPVLVLSHIPILAACPFFDGDNEKTGNWVVPGTWMHIDARRLKDLFHRHPNVRICLSGHIHLLDRVEYNGVTYLCNGALSGSWWKGSYQETPPGYALIDLNGWGVESVVYRQYGWSGPQ